MSNFGFLRAEWPDLFKEAAQAERNTIADPRTTCFYARRTLELTLKWLYEADGSLRASYKKDLSGFINEPTLRNLVGPDLRTKMDIIRKRGNAAVHHATPIKPSEALPVVRELFHVLYWVRAHEDHVAVQKLRRNKQLSPTDLAELERMLAEAGGDEREIDRARQGSNGLGLFIRSLVGMDREAAKAAFGEFLAGKTLTGSQIHFIDLVVNHLTENGTMAPDWLYESPFTDIASQGPEELFTSADVDTLISILDSVRATADPSVTAAQVFPIGGAQAS